MTKISRLASFSTLVSLAALAIASNGCAVSSDPSSVKGRAEVINRSSSALAIGSLAWIDGTYAGCQGHTDGDAWSLRISGSGSMTNSDLTVTKKDASCSLTVTALKADALYESSPSITMTDAFKATASSFAKRVDGDLQPVAFYANAKLGSLGFDGDFTVTILYSDDLRSASPTVNATFAQVSGATSDIQVPAPDYSTDFSGMTVQSDFENKVTSATGNAALSAGDNLGEKYVIVPGSIGTSFAEADAAYGAGTKVDMASTIPAASFLSGGDSLPASRTLIISHTVEGVRAYEVVRITFSAP
jgi:hypothetical protein